MVLNEIPLRGAYLVEEEKHADKRGVFARVFCKDEFARMGLATSFVQVNSSSSIRKGTLRGMHFQLSPRAETKLVRCIRGAAYDVILDLRRNSPSFGRWFGVEISDENRLMVYVPKGFAHGYLTLVENTEVLYFVDEFYAPDLERGVRWDDPTLSIRWPMIPSVISEKDRQLPGFDTVGKMSQCNANVR